MTNQERVPSGIAGLDKCIGSGFEKNSSVLVCGGGGSGKTIFGVQFLMEGIAKHNEVGIYISFEENKEKFFRHMKGFGWDLKTLNDQHKFIFVKYSPQEILKIVKEGGEEIGKLTKDINAKRIVIDSLSAYTVLFDTEAKQREMLVALFEMIAGWDATCIVIAEEDQYPERHKSSIMGFMADAIILLYSIMKSSTTTIRAMQIFKMRGTKHSLNIFPFDMTDKGIVVHPEQEVYEIGK